MRLRFEEPEHAIEHTYDRPRRDAPPCVRLSLYPSTPLVKQPIEIHAPSNPSTWLKQTSYFFVFLLSTNSTLRFTAEIRGSISTLSSKHICRHAFRWGRNGTPPPLPTRTPPALPERCDEIEKWAGRYWRCSSGGGGESKGGGGGGVNER